MGTQNLENVTVCLGCFEKKKKKTSNDKTNLGRGTALAPTARTAQKAQSLIMSATIYIDPIIKPGNNDFITNMIDTSLLEIFRARKHLLKGN